MNEFTRYLLTVIDRLTDDDIEQLLAYLQRLVAEREQTEKVL